MLRATAISLLFVISVGLCGLVAVRISGRQLLSVQSNSMIPTFRRGDAVLVEPLLAVQLSPGDIVAYQSSRSPRVTITHRLIAIDYVRRQLTTAGDAQQDHPDPPVGFSQLQGRAVAVAPGLGWLLDGGHRPVALVATVYLPAAIIIGQELWLLAGRASQPQYQLQPRHS